jgi:hypothetical protein|tara:strand:+ start:952 stop:1146 length:195 start_codon:yes stop_codon:yes gene_type:complete
MGRASALPSTRLRRMVDPEFIKAKIDGGEWKWVKFPSENDYEHGWNKQYDTPRLIDVTPNINED